MKGPLKIEIDGEVYFKSSYSGVQHQCLAVRRERDKVILIDTKNPIDRILLTKDEWEAFIKGVKDGEFDIL